MKPGPVLSQPLVFYILSSVMLALVGCSGPSPSPSLSPTQPSGLGMQFTAALIMKLQELGKLHLADSLASYLPEYGFPAPITIRMLLTHTSGLADFTDFPQLGPWIQNGVAEAAVLIAVSQAPLQFSS